MYFNYSFFSFPKILIKLQKNSLLKSGSYNNYEILWKNEGFFYYIKLFWNKYIYILFIYLNIIHINSQFKCGIDLIRFWVNWFLTVH